MCVYIWVKVCVHTGCMYLWCCFAFFYSVSLCRYICVHEFVYIWLCVYVCLWVYVCVCGGWGGGGEKCQTLPVVRCLHILTITLVGFFPGSFSTIMYGFSPTVTSPFCLENGT